MPKPYSSTEHTRTYRQRLRAGGSEEVLLQLPRATVAMLDAIKERHGLRNRSQAFLQLIGQKGATAQHVELKMRKPALPGGVKRNSRRA